MRKVLERREKRGMSSAEILELLREMYKYLDTRNNIWRNLFEIGR